MPQDMSCAAYPPLATLAFVVPCAFLHRVSRWLTIVDTRAQAFMQACRKDTVEDLIERAMDCTEEALRDAKITTDDLREPIPAAGASQIPAFLEGIEARFEKKASFHAEPF